MHRDTWFLQTHGSLDYSLLVGIIQPKTMQQNLDLLPMKLFLKSQEDPSDREEYRQTPVYNSRARTDEKYVFSIIDVLTEYSGLKTLESLGKRFLYGNTVSPIPPEDYANRFMNFMGTRVLV